jgi:Uma2 family endonuclease
MATVIASPTCGWTVADLLEQLGDVPLHRIHLDPTPGTATEEDLLDQLDHHDCICELIDDTLVEKVVGFWKSIFATKIGCYVGKFVKDNKLGVVAGAGGPLRILANQVRFPDVSYISWDKFPGKKLPRDPIFAIAPDLAVEVLMPENSTGEIQRKLHDYFTAGTKLIWHINPENRTAKVYTSPEHCDILDESQTLTGGAVLPGFELSLKELFAEANPERDEK